MIKHLEKSEDFASITANDKKVVVDFFATWCGPCRMMARVIEEIQEDFEDITFLKVDVDQFPDIAQSYMITNIPSFAFFKDGNSISYSLNGQKGFLLVGGLQEDDFKSLLVETFEK